MIWSTNTMGGKDDGTKSTTELDTHDNMVVVGHQAMIINQYGRYSEVRAFSDECETLHGDPTVDAEIAYYCPYTLKYYLLIVNNSLHVLSI